MMHLERVRGSRVPNQKVSVPVVYIAAMFMAILDTTIVNVALPTMGRSLRTAPDSVGLVSIAYLVSLTVFIPAAGWLGDRFGGRRMLLGSIALFTVGSVLAGTATSLGELVAFRVVQGAGGAIMLPVGLAMLFRVYPPAERVRIASIVALFTALAPALGPVVGGVLTTAASWRLVFFVNAPIGVAALIFGALTLAPHTQAVTDRLDGRGLLLSGLGLGAMMYGLSEGPLRGWASVPVIAALVAGAVLLAAAAVAEWHTATPLLNLRLFGNRLFAAATGLYAMGSAAYLGALYLVALFLQDALGLSALRAGLVIFPSALGVMVGSQLVTRALYRRLGPRRIVIAGLLIMSVTLAALAPVGTGTSRWLIRLALLGLGVGVSFVFVPSQAASMATVSKAQTGQASSIFNAGKQFGAAVGVALLTTVLVAVGGAGSVAGGPAAGLAGYHAGFLAAAGAALIAIPIAASIRDADAADTMRPAPTRRPSSRRGRRPLHDTSAARRGA